MAIIKRADLKKMLIELAEKIDEGDSFEGSLSYSCMTSGLERDEMEVTVAVRVGNLEGQGGMMFLEASKLNEHGVIVGREDVDIANQRRMDAFFAQQKDQEP